MEQVTFSSKVEYFLSRNQQETFHKDLLEVIGAIHGETPIEYATRMLRNAEQPDQDFISVLVDLLERPIHVISADDSFASGGLQFPNTGIFNHQLEPLYVLYFPEIIGEKSGHYQSLVRIPNTHTELDIEYQVCWPHFSLSTGADLPEQSPCCHQLLR